MSVKKTIKDLKDSYYLSVKATLNRCVLEGILNYQEMTYF